MYPVTSLFQEKIKETVRTFKASIQVQHSAGVLTLTDEDIILGTMSIVEDSQTTSDFGVGAAVSTTFEVEIRTKRGLYLVDTILIPVDDMLRPVDWYDDYSDIKFEGATVIPQISLLVGDDVWENVPLGRFTVDEVFKGRTKIKIKALDYMVELDKPYVLSALSYPATLYQIYTNICNVADVQIGTPNFINQEYLVNERPQGDYTLRDMLSFVAAASGSFARFNRLGALELCWYASSGIVLTGANRFDFQAREDVVGISGVSYTTVDDVTYVTGTDEYVVDLTDNPLVQGDLDTLLPNIYDGVKDTKFTPFESRWQGNPAIQPGDSITQIDRDGNSVDTIVTYSAYKYRGASSLAGRGLPLKAKGYKGSTNKKITEVRRALEDNFNRQINEMQEVIEDGMVVTYYQEEKPVGKLGDLWYDTTNELLKRYNGTQWALITDKRIVEAIELAQDAQTTADGKIVSYYQNEMPSEGTIGDLWIDTNDGNKLYRHNGTTFILVRDAGIDEVATDLNNAITGVNTNISTLEQSVLNATEMIANMLGGYVVRTDDALYIADNPNINLAQKVWKWGIGGFGYSSTGIAGPYNTGVSADGTIVAMLVAANIITADMVQTGILQSEDGSTWINLDDGTFNFKNLLKYTDGVLEMPTPELPDDVAKTNVSYNGAVIRPDRGIVVEFEGGGHAQIGDGSILTQHSDGSRTVIDGRGITRIFSVPVFEQRPSGTDIIDTFESGLGRVDLEASSLVQGWEPAWDNGGVDLSTNILTTTEDKYAGTRSLKIKLPSKKWNMVLFGGSGYRSGIDCAFLRYRPTKNTTFTMRYKTVRPTGVTATLYIDDLDFPDIPTQTISLTATSWSSASASLTQYHTYGFRIRIYYSGTSSSDITSHVYVDDMTYELNVNEPVIVGYTESAQPYYDFTYIRKGHFNATGTQQIVLPDYFKGMNFDVLIMPTGDWRWNNTNGVNGEPLVKVDSVNNLIPSFTVTYTEYPSRATDFVYTVVLNN